MNITFLTENILDAVMYGDYGREHKRLREMMKIFCYDYVVRYTTNI